MAHKTTAALAILICVTLAACSDDGDMGGGTPAPDVGVDTADSSGTSDVVPDVPAPEDLGPEPEPDLPAPDAPDDTPDTPDLPPDVAEDVTEDAPDLAEPDLGVMQACDDQTPCPDGYDCVAGVCTLLPSGLIFVENNYQLLQPTALTNVVSFFKGIFSDLGFFMTAMGPLDGDSVEVMYGGADRVTRIDDAPDEWRWQLPDRLPSFTMRRLEGGDPLQSDTWQSEIFTYRLVALYGPEPRAGIGFVAEKTVVTMRFDPELTNIVEGTISGFMTREEAENRFLAISDNCLLQQGACPLVDCENSPLETVADVLDCNEVEPDSDLDDDIPGNDAYATEIYFTSELVTLVE